MKQFNTFYLQSIIQILFTRVISSIIESQIQQQSKKNKSLNLSENRPLKELDNMNNQYKLRCSNKQCQMLLKAGRPFFTHNRKDCNKILCFWCAFEMYNLEARKLRSLSKQKKFEHKIKMPCCPGVSPYQFPRLEEFILNTCPFDGLKCKSAEKYQCADGLTIGKQCWEEFYEFYQNSKKSESITRMVNKTIQYGVRQCLSCDKKISYIFNVQQQCELELCMCIKCYTNQVTLAQKSSNKPKSCHQCKQLQMINETMMKNYPSDGQFVINTFRLILFGETLHCHFCIYMHWILVCKNYIGGKVTFEEFVKTLEQIQILFSERCLACGIKALTHSNVFEFKDQSIQSPYSLMVFLCGNCHALIKNEMKLTKNLHKFKIHLLYTKQIYNEACESIKFTLFKKNVTQWMTNLKNTLQDRNFLEEEKNHYQQILILKDKKQSQKQQTQKEHLKPLQRIQSKKQQVSRQLISKQLHKNQKKLQEIKPKQKEIKNTVAYRQNSKKKPSEEAKQRKKSIRKEVISSKETKQKQILILSQPLNKFNRKVGNKLEKGKTIQDEKFIKKSNDEKRLKLMKNLYGNIFGVDYTQNTLQTSLSKSQSKQQSENMSERELTDVSLQLSNQQLIDYEQLQKGLKNQIKNDSFKLDEFWINQQESMDDEKMHAKQTPKSQYKAEQGSYSLNNQQSSAQDIENKSSFQSVDSKDPRYTKNLKTDVKQNDRKELKQQKGEEQLKQRESNTPNFQGMKEMRQRVLEKQIHKFNQIRPVDNNQFTQNQSLKVNQKNQRASKQPMQQDELYVELQQFKFQNSISQKPFDFINFDQKLVSIVGESNGFFPELLKGAKSAISFQQIVINHNQKENKLKSTNQCVKHICKNDKCKQSQQEFLFLDQYCFSCFNLLLLGKIQQNTKEQQNQRNKLQFNRANKI